MNKKKLSIFVIAFFIILFQLTGCSYIDEWGLANVNDDTNKGNQNYLTRSRQLSFTNLDFTPCNFDKSKAMVGKQEKRPYTVMVYLNGTDLESKEGCATADLQEMLKSRFNSNNVNVIIFTGGTSKWRSNNIPSNSCALYQIKNSKMVRLSTVGLKNMGDAGTLAAFLNFGMEAFPADKYGIVFWNHGGGSIAGYGVDDNFNYDSLTLLELNYALEKSKASTTKLEFIGFDACLMSTLETAVVTQKYANYLIGSEELEPGDGWSYEFLRTLSRYPQMDGAKLGKLVCDSFTSYYRGSGEDTTMAVTKLSRIDGVVNSLERLMAACDKDFTDQSFKIFSKLRNQTKTFGGGSPRENDVDMVDAYDMAKELSSIYPVQAKALMQSVKSAVVYYKDSSTEKDAHGLAIYYIFGATDDANDALAFYRKLAISNSYTDYLKKFAKMLTGNDRTGINKIIASKPEAENGGYTIKLTKKQLDNLLTVYFTLWEPVDDEADYYFMLGQTGNVDIEEDGTILTKFNGEWWGIDGDFVCMYETSRTSKGTEYAIPATLNGEDVDIIAMVNKADTKGEILGARPYTENSNMAAKLLLPIKDGDKVRFDYDAVYFGDDPAKEADMWYETDDIIVDDKLTLEKLSINAGEKYLYGFSCTDVQQNTYYTDFVEVEFAE